MAFTFLRSLLALSTFCLTLVSADFVSDLTSQGYTVLVPGSSGFTTASAAFNRRYTIQPAAIAFPNNANDVSNAIKLANTYDINVVARSGGHSYIANGLGGKSGLLVIDMKNFNTVSYDASTNVATIGTGNRLGTVATGLNNNGRALPHGTCPYVGFGGHSGHGGYGFTSRQWGLTLDTILSYDVVLANGTIATASNTTNSDLYWALKGASSSFGIVTNVRTTTFPAPSSVTIFEYSWDMTASAAASALLAFQTFSNSAGLSTAFGAEINLGQGSKKGRVWLGLTGGWYAPANQFDAAIAPLLAQLPTPGTKKLTVGTYINSVKYLGGLNTLSVTAPETPDTFYAKSLMTPQASLISSTAANAFMTYLANNAFGVNTDWFVQFELYGGTNSAINKVPLSSTAFGRRSSMFTVQIYTSAQGGVPPFPSAGFTLLDGMANSLVNNSPAGWDYGAYANYADDRLTNWQNLYYSTNYPRLQTLKNKYDPQDTFHFPTSIEL